MVLEGVVVLELGVVVVVVMIGNLGPVLDKKRQAGW